MAIDSIASALGTGSGIDTTALIQGLLDAQFAAKTEKITTREEALTAQISAAAKHKSNIATFASALSNVTRSGSLVTQPTTSHSNILTVTRNAGADLSNLNARVEVRQLASGQSAASGFFSSKDAVVGQGALTLTLGTATMTDGAMTDFVAGDTPPVTINIGPENATLEGIVAAINAANAGVDASILTDSNGSRLVLKGGNGESRAFTLSAEESPESPGLSALNLGPGNSNMTIGTTAADAIVAVDGIAVRGQTNRFNDLVPGVRIDLTAAQPGTVVTIGSTPPTAALLQTAQDWVATYNELFTALNADLNAVGGALRSDIAARTLRSQLQQLTMVELIDGQEGEPTTLAQIGIRTERDGQLSVDTAMLSRMLLQHPQVIERMFAEAVGSSATKNGIAGALNAIATEATSTTRGLGASEISYNSAKSKLADERAKVLEQTESARTRMTRQFAGMDARVAAYKSTMTFLENQIAAWNKQD